MADERAIPVLRIDDYAEAKAYYVDWLGFAIDWEHRFGPDFPVYMSLTRGSLTIHLTQHRGDCDGGGAVYFYLDDVPAYHAELAARRPESTERPVERDWGMCELTLTDPFGNRLRFGSPVAKR